MKNGRSGLAALAAAAVLLTASPVLADFAICTAQDSDSRSYVSKQQNVLSQRSTHFAELLAMTECQARSRHPQSCKIVSCTLTP